MTVTQSCCPAEGKEETAHAFIHFSLKIVVKCVPRGPRDGKCVLGGGGASGRTDEGGHLRGGPSHGVDHVRFRPGVQHHPRDVGLTCGREEESRQQALKITKGMRL